MSDIRFEIYFVRRNIVSTGQSVRVFKKIIFRLFFIFEITRDFSSKSLVVAIRHFIARRGELALFVSDNLKSFNDVDVKQFILKNQFNWQFILKRSPCWGGFYERLVSTVKSSLKKTIGKTKISRVEMCTIIFTAKDLC